MIMFQLSFEVSEDKRAAFEETYHTVFEPALSRQEGFLGATFTRLYAPAVVAEINAAPSEFNYQVVFRFESEAKRRVWATSPDHDVAWPKLSALTSRAVWRGWDVLKHG